MSGTVSPPTGRGRKLSTGWSLARARFAQRYRSRTRAPDAAPSATPFDRLPVELLAQIFSRVHVSDLVSLQCTSRAFRDVIDVNSALIARRYVRVHGLTTLSGLFPPPVIPATNRPCFDVRYLLGLTRREQTCRELSGYLTERILERCFNMPIQRLKPKTRTVIETCLADELTQRMIYVLYFLTEYARRRTQTLEMLATHRSLVSSLPRSSNNSPRPPNPTRSELFRAFQVSIIASLPDNTLIETHHTMHLLVKHMRLSTCPTPPHQKNDPWISMLLHKSGLQRITEFFAADMPYASHSTRKAFARAMQRDFDELEAMNQAVSPSEISDPNGAFPFEMERDVPPPIREIWFDAAHEVLRKRKLEPHAKEGLAVGMFGGLIVDDLTCTGCIGGR
ncbi:hypothetical protein ABW21_db0205359 [Orbilia brochopaga]|nr:hypothetical protein ABW21_db0205359 [Drechslerella brochopaga]